MACIDILVCDLRWHITHVFLVNMTNRHELKEYWKNHGSELFPRLNFSKLNLFLAFRDLWLRPYFPYERNFILMAVVKFEQLIPSLLNNFYSPRLRGQSFLQTATKNLILDKIYFLVYQKPRKWIYCEIYIITAYSNWYPTYLKHSIYETSGFTEIFI